MAPVDMILSEGFARCTKLGQNSGWESPEQERTFIKTPAVLMAKNLNLHAGRTKAVLLI
jgi:hypothetical protein